MLTAPPVAPTDISESLPDLDESGKAELDRMIGEAAYYIAQQRGFEPGHELDDWLAAEAQIHDQLAARR